MKTSFLGHLATTTHKEYSGRKRAAEMILHAAVRPLFPPRDHALVKGPGFPFHYFKSFSARTRESSSKIFPVAANHP